MYNFLLQFHRHSRCMKEESLIPEALKGAFKDFASLKSDQEKEVFWVELAKNLKGTSPETLGQLLREGLLRIR